MPIERQNEIQHFRAAPFSPHIRWLEVASNCVIELLRLKQRAKILAAAHPEDPAVFFGFERETLRKMGSCVREGLGWNVTHNTDLPEANPADRFVFFGNHTTLTATWPFGEFINDNFASNLAAVGKREIIDNHISRWSLGDLMLMTRKGIFIDRENRNESIQAIREHAASILIPGTAAVIFLDEHRPYPRRIKKQQKEWDLKKPDLEVGRWMTGTCFPKSGGLWNLAEVIRELDGVRFLDCTVVEPFSVYRFGGELHFDVREISREELLGSPESEEHLRKKLVELWKRKNEMIRERRSARPQVSV